MDTWNGGFQATTDDMYTDLWENTTDPLDNVTAYSLKEQRLYRAYNAMVAINSAFITLAMGAGVDFSAIKPNIKKPIGPAIGVICQSILMPAVCFGFAVVLELDAGIAIGMLITGSCPGGALSNIFTFWSRGDLTLSVVMTVVSTTLAIGFLPLNMFIYTRYWTSDDTVSDIPYKNMVFSMLYTWVAVAIGMTIAWKAPRAAKYVAKIGSFVGFLMMAVSGVLQSQVYDDLFVLDTDTWVAGLTMPLIASIMGFTISSCFHRWINLAQKRAIAYETGVQNVAVALAVIALSFERSESADYNVVPMIYAFSSIVLGLFSCFVHQMYFRHNEGSHPFKSCPKNGTADSTCNYSLDDAISNLDGFMNLAYDGSVASSVSMEPGGATSVSVSGMCIGTPTDKSSSVLDPKKNSYFHPETNELSFRSPNSYDFRTKYPT